MSDEFPTLEVALAASVAVLAWRGLLLRRSRLGFLSASDRLLQSFRHGPPSVRELTAAQLGPLLEPLARAALTAHASETGKAVGERTGRVRRRVRSAAARDLVICAVLLGSLLYTSSSGITRGWAFFALGGAATLILLAAIFERLRLDRELERTGTLFAKAVSSLGAAAARGVLTCRVCGAPFRERLTTPEDLGPRLWALGAREVLACHNCGHLTGQIETLGGGAPS